MKKKENLNREAGTSQLSYADIIPIRGYLEQIDVIQKDIDDLEAEIRKRIIAPMRKNSAIVMSIPG